MEGYTTAELQVQAEYDGTAYEQNEPVVFSSSNESVATVDENGIVKAVGTGYAYIYAGTESSPRWTSTYFTVVEKAYEVTFDLNGGTILADDYKELLTYGRVVSSTSSVYLPGSNYVGKEGYALDGWTTVKNGDTVISGYIYPEENTVVYAHWAEAYMVRFDLNGGTVGSSPSYTRDKAVKKGDRIYLNTGDSVATKEGYTLAGWTETKDADTVIGYSYTPTGDTTLYAKWGKNYTITFDLNGGTWEEGSEYDQTSIWYEGKSYLDTPSDGNMIMEGCTVAGWSLTADGEKIDTYGFTTDKDCTLYAIWAKEYSIKFDPNGGTWQDGYESWQTTGTTWHEGSSYLTTPYIRSAEKEGFALSGWSLTADGEKINTNEFSTDKDLTLYAVWEKIYTITFDPNGGTWAEGSEYYQTEGVTWYNGQNYLDRPYSNDVSKDGYILTGWSLTASGETISLYEFSTTKDCTLYAIWKKQCTLKLDTNGGTWNEGYEEYYSSRTMSEGDRTWLPDDDYYLTRKGYKLIGWSETKTGGKVISNNILLTKDVTLYAQWAAAYTVKLNANGGTIAGDNKLLVVKGEECSLPLGAYATRSGYQLAGWTVQKDTGTVLRGYYTPTKNITLYASWAKNVTLVLKAGDGVFETKKHSQKVTVGYGLPVGTDLPSPTLKNQVFLGWYYDQDYTKPVKKASVFKKKTTLYAKWQATPIKVVVYNLKGSSYHNRRTNTYVSASESTADYYSFVIDKGDVIGNISAQKDGYKAKFYFDKSFTKPYYYDYVPTKTTKVYAKWVKAVTVKWSAAGGARMRYYSDGETVAEKTGSVTSYKTLMCEDLPDSSDMKRTGYYFIGWYLSTDSTKTILKPSHVFNKNATVKAKWGKGIKIVLKLKGGTMSSYYESRLLPRFYMKKNKTIGSAVGYIPVPTKEGYTFNGWKSSVTGDVVKNLYSEKPTQDTAYTATWKKAADPAAVATVTVTLKGGYGSIWNPDNRKYVTSMKVKVTKNSTYYSYFLDEYAPSHDERGKHLIFAGWSLEKENGAEVAESYKFTKNVVLYPIWKAYDLRVALVTNGGSYNNRARNTPIIMLSAQNGKITLPTAKQMEREGYTFAGWYSDSKFTNKLSNQTAYRVKKTGVYLYAKWTKNS